MSWVDGGTECLNTASNAKHNRPTGLEINVTEIGDDRRLARPPLKSPAPQENALPSANNMDSDKFPWEFIRPKGVGTDTDSVMNAIFAQRI
jgi:hypothetical protein